MVKRVCDGYGRVAVRWQDDMQRAVAVPSE